MTPQLGGIIEVVRETPICEPTMVQHMTDLEPCNRLIFSTSSSDTHFSNLLPPDFPELRCVTFDSIPCDGSTDNEHCWEHD